MSPSPPPRAARPLSLQRFIWRSYLSSALVPVFFIELALIAAYLVTNSIIRDQNIATLRRLATEQLQHTAHQQAEQISTQLASVAYNAELLRRQTERALVTPFVPGPEESARYALSNGGAFYTTQGGPGQAAVFYSNRTHIGEAERTKALRLAQLDPLLASLVETHPLVTQAYVHTWDNMVRIHPYRQLLEIFSQDYSPTSYNYYYEADAVHDPERKVVWTDLYIDPAGQGWMASAIAPVYPAGGDRLEAVVGLDVTVARFVQQVLRLHLPWNGYGVLVDKHGTLLALPAQGEQDWGLKELTHYTYQGVIQRDTFKPDTFNLLKREDSRALGERMASQQEGLETLLLAAHPKQVAWSTVKGTQWKLLVVVDEADIFAQARSLNQRILRVGLGMIAALVLFYVLFFAWLYRKVHGMSTVLVSPLLDLEALMRRMGQGQYLQKQPTYPILELQRTGQWLVLMGSSLAQSDTSLRTARKELEQLNQQLEERIQHRTRELEATNAALHQENLAKKALIQELRRTQSQLIHSEKLASLARLTAGIAHELRNPLNFITNLSECSVELAQELDRTRAEQPWTPLAQVQDLLSELTHNAAVVQQHGLRAEQIIRSMMEHARGRAGKPEPTDLQPLVERYLWLTYHGAHVEHPGPEVTFLREFDPDVVRVQATPQELGRLLQNLIHNALDAVFAKQRESRGAYVPTITLRIHREQDHVILQVEDNGTGIPKDIQERIFEPFFTTKPPGVGGTGLGLSLSYDIVKAHGGSLTVESEPGRHACFTVKLPVHERD